MRWLGIPYAKAARFAAPEIEPFDASRTYDTFGPAAPQALDSPLTSVVPGMSIPAYDEHTCLTLNVWSPDEDAADLPVLVWFHGGSFVIGASSQPVYDGALLASEQRVVVVTVNYRLGALGFLDARPLGGVANTGVRDAICALEWVRDNIAFFGGDPARVVAFGESAGGGLLLHAIASPSARDLVAGVIVQSGATFATLDEESAAAVRDALMKQVDGRDLRTLEVGELVAAQSRAMSDLLGTIGMMPFHPMVDGESVPAAPSDALAAGAAANTPLLLGTTSDEMRLFVGGAALSHDRLVRRVSRYLHIDEEEAEEVVARYGNDDAGAVWCSVFSDYEMVHPARAVLDAHAAHGPTFAYLFTWEGPDVGACHGIDIPFPFGNFGDGWAAFVGADDDAFALSRLMRDAWAAFARDGAPGWDAYPATMILGRASHVEPSHPLFARLRAR